MVKRPLILLFVCFFCLPAHANAKVYRQGDPAVKKIAITVDDCTKPGILTEMLDLFSEHEIRVTFFVLGNALRLSDREIWQRAVADGHEIGNHTFGHASLNVIDGPAVQSQLRRAENAFNETLGYPYNMQVMRPPYGRCRENGALTRIQNAGYQHVILWTVAQTDPQKALKAISNGSICLFHTNAKDLLCLQEIIPVLKAEGYEMVTVSDLLGITER